MLEYQDADVFLVDVQKPGRWYLLLDLKMSRLGNGIRRAVSRLV